MRDGRQTTNERTNEQVKIELLSRWKLEAEFRNFHAIVNNKLRQQSKKILDSIFPPH